MPAVEAATRSAFITALYRRLSPDKPLRILLAEDDFEMRRLLSSALTRAGFEVIEVASGTALLDVVASQILRPRGRAHELPPIDLIISDVIMPGQSGLEVLAGLRRADWSTPFILITAFGDETVHAEATRLGAVCMFDKPFDVDDLLTVISNLASTR